MLDFALGKIPTLDVTENGVTTRLAQSKAIERFLAKRFGFFGDNDLEGARIDMITEHIRDIKDACAHPFTTHSTHSRPRPAYSGFCPL